VTIPSFPPSTENAASDLPAETRQPEQAKSGSEATNETAAPQSLTETDVNDVPMEATESATTEPHSDSPRASGTTDVRVEMTDEEKSKYEAKSIGSGSQGLQPVNTNVDFFGIKSTGKHVAYVIDKSSSMSGRRFALAKKELIKSIERLEDNQKFSIYLFNDADQTNRNFVNCSATSKKIDSAKSWLLQVNASGGTRPIPSMQAALSNGPDTIFLLSDGEFAHGAPAAIVRSNGKQIPIHTISMDVDSATLKEIAKRCGGQYRWLR
jgi:hypothetical protein